MDEKQKRFMIVTSAVMDLLTERMNAIESDLLKRAIKLQIEASQTVIDYYREIYEIPEDWDEYV
jgi:hypothetical protein